MTLQLNFRQTSLLYDSIGSRLTTIDRLIELFKDDEDQFLFEHYSADKLLLTELKTKLYEY